MQLPRGAAGGCGCALFPLLSILFVQGECASWLGATSGLGGVRKDGRSSGSGLGGLRKPPARFLGREGMWEDVLTRLSPPTAESWSPVVARALPGVT